MRDAKRTVEAVLEAAERLIVQKGVAKTTLDEVAREAAISKGGVLHHFPNKESILVGLLRKLIAQYEEHMEGHRVQDPEPNGAFTRAYLNTALETEPHCAEVFLALSAAFRDTPALQDMLREAGTRWQAKVENDGIDPVHASMVRFASDGLRLARLRGVTAPSEPVRQALLDSLLAFTRCDNASQIEPAVHHARAIL